MYYAIFKLSIYLLLTEVEVRIVSYEFFPLRFIAQARSPRAINRREK